MMKKKSNRWLLAVLLLLALAVPAAVVARGERDAGAPAPQSSGAKSQDEAKEEELDEFEPSEQVEADEAISFPVDI